MIEKLEELESQINAIADRLSALEGKPLHETMLQPVIRPAYKPRTSTSKESNLPDGLVPLYLFYHNVPANTAKRLLEVAGVNIIRGHWIAGGHHFDKALNADGQRQAYEALHTHPRFKPCPDCPHHT